MNIQVTRIFIPIVSQKDSFCHRGKSKLGIGLFIHELLKEPLILIGIEELDGFAKYFLFLPALLLARFTTVFNCLASLALPKPCVGTLNCPATIALMALLDAIFSYSVSVGNS